MQRDSEKKKEKQESRTTNPATEQQPARQPAHKITPATPSEAPTAGLLPLSVFMPEDTEAGMIVGFLETYQGNQVCSKQFVFYCQ